MTHRGTKSIVAAGALVLAALAGGCKSTMSSMTDAMSTAASGVTAGITAMPGMSPTTPAVPGSTAFAGSATPAVAGFKMPDGVNQGMGIAQAVTPQSGTPSDAAVLAPPDIFVARSDNCLASAELPDSPVHDVVAVAGSANLFDVEVPNVTTVGATQRKDDWCWAACTQTLLAQQSIQVTQPDLVKHFAPDPDDQTASIGTIVRALNPEMGPQLEQKGAIPIDLVGLTSDQMVTELLAGRLCVVGLFQKKEGADPVGHACVVCGAKFSRLTPSLLGTVLTAAPPAPGNAPNNAQPNLNSKLNPVYGLTEVTLFDPEPGVGIRKLTADQFHDQTDFFTSRELSRQLLANALNPQMGTAADQGSAGTSKRTKITVLSTREETVRLKSLPKRRLVSAQKRANTPPGGKKKKKDGDPDNSNPAAKTSTPQQSATTPPATPAQKPKPKNK